MLILHSKKHRDGTEALIVESKCLVGILGQTKDGVRL
jgi:hypothetical protein